MSNPLRDPKVLAAERAFARSRAPLIEKAADRSEILKPKWLDDLTDWIKQNAPAEPPYLFLSLRGASATLECESGRCRLEVSAPLLQNDIALIKEVALEGLLVSDYEGVKDEMNASHHFEWKSKHA